MSRVGLLEQAGYGTNGARTSLDNTMIVNKTEIVCQDHRADIVSDKTADKRRY